MKIAICTSDSREGTLQFLKREGLSDLVDMVVCGDDPESKPKPGECIYQAYSTFKFFSSYLKLRLIVLGCINKCFFDLQFCSDPHNALHICKTLGIEPSKTIMVGDTPADTLMGQEVSELQRSIMYESDIFENRSRR